MRGLKRSGNHAVSNVLRGCADVFYKNNIVNISAYLRRGAVPPEPQEFMEWCKRVGVNRRDVLVSLEDHELCYEPFRSVGLPIREVIVIRDPYNMLASRFAVAMQKDA
jgi:hypothetical protein